MANLSTPRRGTLPGSPAKHSPPALEGVLSAREFGRLGGLLLGSAGVLGGASNLIVLEARGASYRPGTGFHPVVVWALSAAALLAGFVTVRWPERLYPRWTAPLMAIGTVVITAAAYDAGPIHGPYVTMFYIWVGASFLVLSPRIAAAQVAFVGVMYAVLLAVQPGHESALAEWVFTFGVIALTAWVVKRVVETFVELARAERSARADVQRGNDTLEELSRRETAFVSRISHEVRNPLNAILGFADMLGAGYVGPLNEQQSDYVGEVRSSGRHLLDLIGDILDVKRVSEGREDLVVGDVSLVPVVVNAVSLFRNDARRQDIELDLGPVPERLIVGDERKIRQVLLNLLSNAIKFTNAGGRVEVTTTVARNDVVITVADTGCGIEPDDIERIFEEYRQSPAGVAHGAGTGLGLPLARRFAEQHDGSLDVRSEVGRGSTFTLRLPIAGPHLDPVEARDLVTRAIEGLRGARWRRPLENPRLRAGMAPLPARLGIGGVILGAITLFIHLLHPTDDYRPIPLVVLALSGTIVLVVALNYHRRLTTGTMTALIATATLTLTASDYFVGSRSQPYGSMLYVWIGISAVSFLSRRQAALQVGFAGAAYAVVLAVQSGNQIPVAGWLIVLGVVAVSTLAIDTLFGRLGALADAERVARVRLEAIRAELEEASRYKAQFVATMSHELRTPLNAIIGFSEVLGDEMFGPLTEQQREYVADLTEAGRELLALVNDILDLAKVEAGRMDLTISEGVDVATIVRSVCASHRPVPVCIRLADRVGPIDVDERKLQRILANLVDEGASASGTTEVEVVVDAAEGWLFVDVIYDRPVGSRPVTGDHPLRIGVAAALAELHGGSVDAVPLGWRLALPSRPSVARLREVDA